MLGWALFFFFLFFFSFPARHIYFNHPRRQPPTGHASLYCFLALSRLSLSDFLLRGRAPVPDYLIRTLLLPRDSIGQLEVLFLSTSCKCRPISKRLAVHPEQYRPRPSDRHSHKSQQCVSPSVPQPRVQTRCKQRESKTRQTPQYRARSDGGRGVASISVNEETLDTLEAYDHPHCKDGNADIRPNPKRFVLRRPAVRDEPYRHENCAWNHPIPHSKGQNFALPVKGQLFQEYIGLLNVLTESCGSNLCTRLKDNQTLLAKNTYMGIRNSGRPTITPYRFFRRAYILSCKGAHVCAPRNRPTPRAM